MRPGGPKVSPLESGDAFYASEDEEYRGWLVQCCCWWLLFFLHLHISESIARGRSDAPYITCGSIAESPLKPEKDNENGGCSRT